LNSATVEPAEWRWVFILTGVLVIILLLPTLVAFAAAGAGFTFTGVMAAPGQGANYLAQMAQGQRGQWLLTAPFTPEPHPGITMVTFYLLLGHVARLLTVDPVLIYHAVRVFGTFIMGLAVYRFAALWTGDLTQRRLTWVLAMCGPGLGWVLAFDGQLRPGVIGLLETFPLRGAYLTAHLPWMVTALAAIATIYLLSMFSWQNHPPELNPYSVALASAALVLASTVPHTFLPLLLAVGAAVTMRGGLPQYASGWLLLPLVVALPVMTYLMWAYTASDPVVAAWIRQSDPGMLPVPTLLLAASPLLVLGGVGLWGGRHRFEADDLFLSVWGLSALLLTALPIAHAYLFALGFTLPLGVLAARGIKRVIAPKLSTFWRAAALVALFALLLPTNLAAVVVTRPPEALYLSDAEAAALQWSAENIPPTSVMLASPELSVFIPRYGPHVVYAAMPTTPTTHQQSVYAYFSGADCSVVRQAGVDYMLLGPRERALVAEEGCLPDDDPIYQTPDGSVRLYRLSP
jgi:hypothetical protein